MSLKKYIKEYEEKYGHISKDTYERFMQLVRDKKITAKDLQKIKKKIINLSFMTWSETSFVLYLIPKASPRPRSGRFGNFYVKDAKENNVLFEQFMTTTFGEIHERITTGCVARMDIYMPIPSTMNRVDAVLAELKLIRPLPKPDWDNLGKTYSDMVQRSLLAEDSLVIDGRVRKFYSYKPRIELVFSYQDKYDSLYNKRKVESWATYDPEMDVERDYIE